jgi:hypothetical protein
MNFMMEVEDRKTKGLANPPFKTKLRERINLKYPFQKQLNFQILAEYLQPPLHLTPIKNERQLQKGNAACCN